MGARNSKTSQAISHGVGDFFLMVLMQLILQMKLRHQLVK